jgi:hypothetical protein
MEIATAKAAVLPQSMGRPFWLQPVAEQRRALTKRLVSTYRIHYLCYKCMLQQLSSLLATCAVITSVTSMQQCCAANAQ